MPSVQLFELAMHPPTEQFDAFLQEAMPYFPRWSRAIMGEWRESSADGQNVVSLIEKGEIPFDEAAKGGLVRLVEEFKSFRRAHNGVTSKKIGGAFSRGRPLSDRELIAEGLEEKPIMEDGVMGTGGFNIEHVLTNGVRRMLSLRQRVLAIEPTS